jgi:uncharacterized protein
MRPIRGTSNQAKTAFSDDSGRQLENVVFLHLRRKNREIFFFTRQGECDFVVMEKGKAVVIIQVCRQVDDMNMKRKIPGLKTALDYFGLKDGVIASPKFQPEDEINCGTSEGTQCITLRKIRPT